MIMKRLALHTLVAAAALLFGACAADDSAADDTTRQPLQLCASAEGIFTDGLDIAFDIVSGVAPFTVQVSKTELGLDAAIVTIEGRHVTAELFDSCVEIRITDAAGECASVKAVTSHPAVSYSKISLVADRGYGCRNIFDLTFGAGAPYTIVGRDSDTGAYGYRIEGNTIVCENTSPAVLKSHYADISDCRGLVRRLDIGLGLGYDITGSELSVSVIRGTRLTFPFLWGEGWQVIEGATDPLTFMWQAVRDSSAAGPLRDTFFLSAESDATYRFADRNGNLVTLRIETCE